MTPTDPTPDRMLTREDETAERGGNPLVTAASLLVGAGFIAMVALVIWGWVA